MNLINFEPQECRRVRSSLDGYLSNKLPVTAAAELQAHLAECAACSALFAERARLRETLQRAVQNEAAPPDLERRIRQQLRATAPPQRANNFRLWAAAAAALLLLFGGWAAFRWTAARRTAADQQLMAAVFNIGLSDHVQCTINHQPKKENWPTPRMQQSLGADFVGLLPLTEAHLPTGYELELAHRCRVAGREFIHAILRSPTRTLSLIITKKDHESYPARVAAALQAEGVKLHRARLQDYELAGFETNQYLTYVVSNAEQSEHLQIAARLAPPVRDFLAKLETAAG